MQAICGVVTPSLPTQVVRGTQHTLQRYKGIKQGVYPILPDARPLKTPIDYPFPSSVMKTAAPGPY